MDPILVMAEQKRKVDALFALDAARRRVMDLGGGNLDHPALRHIEAAMLAVEETAKEGQAHG